MSEITSIGDRKLKVLVTGFDAFKTDGGAIDRNPAGEAVQLLGAKRDIIEDNCQIDLYTEVIPVRYKFVDEFVPYFWDKIQPHLSIHVGVSGETSGLTLENLAEKESYEVNDDQECCPDCKRNPADGPVRLMTDLSVKKIYDDFNSTLPEGAEPANISYDAGKYLCEYIFYSSLAQYEKMNRSKLALFVHVPNKTTDDDIKDIFKQLEHLINICVKHARKHYENCLCEEY